MRQDGELRGISISFIFDPDHHYGVFLEICSTSQFQVFNAVKLPEGKWTNDDTDEDG